MPSKIPEARWAKLIQENRDGKTIAQICRENDDVKKSTFRYHLKKANSEPAESEQEPVQVQTQVQEPIVQEPIVQTQVQVQEQAPPRTTVTINKRDDFLTSFAPENFKTQPQNRNAVDSLFSIDDIFQPETLTVPVKAKSESKPLAGITKASWFSGKGPKTVLGLTESEQQEDNEQLVLVQKIRLYFVHFPELQKLHIVTKKKNTDEPDTEKWLISLYNKKRADLEKTLNFIRFHVRNNINENSSIKLASNVLETGVKVLEHVLLSVGVQSQDLTKNVLADDDIKRCLKEILIDNSINSLNIGAKSDLVLKLGMKIVSTDSQNRIDKQINQQAAKAQGTPSNLNDDLAKKYSDL
eukprot:m.356709 g.356709  ORF g.356709 m.356709 type:complete len:354 (-) comp16606_c0_seq6:3471-4532(-)